jgi:hypothetical protein
VVLEYAFYKLVQEVECKKFVNISPWEAVREGLMNGKSVTKRQMREELNIPQYHGEFRSRPRECLDQIR